MARKLIAGVTIFVASVVGGASAATAHTLVVTPSGGGTGHTGPLGGDHQGHSHGHVKACPHNEANGVVDFVGGGC